MIDLYINHNNDYTTLNNKVGSSDLQSGKTLTSLMGNTEIPSEIGTTVTGALSNIPFKFGIDSSTGDYGYIKAGADSVTPFKTGGMKSETKSHSFTIPSDNNYHQIYYKNNSATSTILKGLLYYTSINLTFSNNISAVSVNVTTFPQYFYYGGGPSGDMPTTYRNFGFYYSISGNTVSLIVKIHVPVLGGATYMYFNTNTVAFNVTGYYQ